MVETKSGSFDGLIAIAGRLLNAGQLRDETERNLRLSRNSGEQPKLEQTRKKDAEQCDAFLKMVTEAFLNPLAKAATVMPTNLIVHPPAQPSGGWDGQFEQCVRGL